MGDYTLSVADYDPSRGVVISPEGGYISVEITDGGVEIFGDPAGLRDLARWCLVLSDERAGSGAHIHLDPGTVPLTCESSPLMLARDPAAPRDCSASGG
ncbi:Imm32 family immunity protein [Luedemannella helvata]|uniref:Imm32 family immunity protein n=1 Tax=Luedemannella helvata TaxID=349315 RepID=UPI0031D430D9